MVAILAGAVDRGGEVVPVGRLRSATADDNVAIREGKGICRGVWISTTDG